MKKPTQAWAVLSFNAIVPGVWGTPHGLLAIFRSRDMAELMARADAHLEHPSRVARVEIREIQPAGGPKAKANEMLETMLTEGAPKP